jgi:hypothetical protein
MTPEDRYSELVAAFADDPAVTLPGPGSAWGADALKVNGKIFAMLHADRLVVKLPRTRVQALIEAGEGHPFGSGGRVMREWVTIDPSGEERWLPLATEALAFVRRDR